MKEEINIKAAGVVILSVILGVYIIFYQDQIIAGIIIIAGGVSLNFIEFLKWCREIRSLFRSFGKEETLHQTQEDSPFGTQALATHGGKVIIKNHYYSSDLPKKNLQDERIPQIITEINTDISTNKVS